jgi:AmmeMemoRadiSam system protein B
VAGAFYPDDPEELRAALDTAFTLARGSSDVGSPPKALIVPHAGYAYSGPVAASAYRALKAAEGIRRVVLLGPSHFVPVEGLASSTAGGFRTPLGVIPVDDGTLEALSSTPGCALDDRPHAGEHSLEVQLPFLQRSLGTFSIVPLLAGRARPEDVARGLEAVWGGRETLLVVSTDLSHYLPAAAAAARDRRTAETIVALGHAAIGERDACGVSPLRGLLLAASWHGLWVTELDLRNSGDTAGTVDRVVGYGAFALREAEQRGPSDLLQQVHE